MWYFEHHSEDFFLGEPCYTEDCKLVVTCKMQNRNTTDKLNQQCSKLALFANAIIEICGRITMLVHYIVDLAYQLHFYFAFCK